jgi:hypothetical protein
MAFKRVVGAARPPTRDELTRAMVGIGMRFAAEPSADPNIEDTLLAASIEGMEHDDLRVLAILCTWLGAHHPWINADRLVRVIATCRTPARTRGFWKAVAQWLEKDQRFARLKRLYRGPRIDVPRIGADFHIRRKGEDERFRGTILRVPLNVLRDRAVDVMPPMKLAKKHRAYRMRVLIGPTYRADMWAALDKNPTLSTAELARSTYGSFATAWQVKKDHDLLAA